jgi:hypothetical protein
MQWIDRLPDHDFTLDLLSHDAFLEPVNLLGDVSNKDLSNYLEASKGISTVGCGVKGTDTGTGEGEEGANGPAWVGSHVPDANADGGDYGQAGASGHGRGGKDGEDDDEDDDNEGTEGDDGSGDMEEDFSGYNALHLAASIGHVGTVRLLLQLRPADVDQAALDSQRHAPLHMASAHHHIDVVRVLLDHGAKVQLQDGLGCTALHIAVRAGAHAIVRLLVCWCVELLHMRDAAGRTPLHDAIIKGDEETVRLLLDYGADPAAVVAQNGAPGYNTTNQS